MILQYWSLGTAQSTDSAQCTQGLHLAKLKFIYVHVSSRIVFTCLRYTLLPLAFGPVSSFILPWERSQHVSLGTNGDTHNSCSGCLSTREEGEKRKQHKQQRIWNQWMEKGMWACIVMVWWWWWCGNSDGVVMVIVWWWCGYGDGRWWWWCGNSDGVVVMMVWWWCGYGDGA